MTLKANLAVKGKDARALVVYDNFEFQENVKHQVIGDHGAMRSVTTGKLIIGIDIPKGGLKQSMLDESVGLTIDDVFGAPGLHEDKLQIDIPTYFITEAIR